MYPALIHEKYRFRCRKYILPFVCLSCLLTSAIEFRAMAHHNDYSVEYQPDKEVVSIISDQLGTYGVGSIYADYTFHYQSEAIVTNPIWSYTLYNLDGEEIEISSYFGETFTIYPLQSPELYRADSNGNIVGKIDLACDIDNGNYINISVPVTLSQQPYIKGIEDLQIIPNGSYRDLTCTVEYFGADKITATLEEDFVSLLRTFDIYEPLSAHINIPYITYHNDAWLDILIKNEYGHILHTIDLPGGYIINRPTESDLDNNLTDSASGISVFNSQGLFIGSFDSLDEAKTKLLSGLYIVKALSDKKTQTSKILITR